MKRLLLRDYELVKSVSCSLDRADGPNCMRIIRVCHLDRKRTGSVEVVYINTYVIFRSYGYPRIHYLEYCVCGIHPIDEKITNNLNINLEFLYLNIL